MVNGGVVYLVGAGPGDPELITLRGLKCLRQADVILYDRLVSEELLDEAPPTAERIYVGKEPGHQALTQDKINQLLIARAHGGEVVVRLKGGDPFVFGRGGEEAAACSAAGVRWEVVPGVTSAIAVPSLAGIPVTHRGVSRAFAVVTAQSAVEPSDRLDWAALATIDTLVVLMGVERLPHIVTMLKQNGRCDNAPIALIERGTLVDERIVTGTLGTIVERTRQAGIESPATIVIGEVVKVRELLYGMVENVSDLSF